MVECLNTAIPTSTFPRRLFVNREWNAARLNSLLLWRLHSILHQHNGTLPQRDRLPPPRLLSSVVNPDGERESTMANVWARADAAEVQRARRGGVHIASEKHAQHTRPREESEVMSDQLTSVSGNSLSSRSSYSIEHTYVEEQ